MSALLSTSGLPDVLQPVGTPDPGRRSRILAGRQPGGVQIAASVVKIRGVATSCQKVLRRHRLIIALNRVMSNAHARRRGSDSVTAGGRKGNEVHDATVVSYDPNADILHPSTSRTFPNSRWCSPTNRPRPAPTPWCWGIPVVASSGGGDPGAGPRDHRLNGPDIYKTTTVNREGLLPSERACSGREFGRSMIQSGRPGHRGGVRRGRRRQRHRLRPDHRWGAPTLAKIGTAPVPTGASRQRWIGRRFGAQRRGVRQSISSRTGTAAVPPFASAGAPRGHSDPAPATVWNRPREAYRRLRSHTGSPSTYGSASPRRCSSRGRSISFMNRRPSLRNWLRTAQRWQLSALWAADGIWIALAQMGDVLRKNPRRQPISLRGAAGPGFPVPAASWRVSTCSGHRGTW